MASNLEVAFLWHMHQPDYRDRGRGEYALPWVYLHALKDYTDMAAHLERHPGMRAVVNFVPVLLDQIDDYAAQFSTGDLRDPLLRMLGRGDFSTLGEPERAYLLDACFRSNHHTMVAPFPHYKRLQELYLSLSSDSVGALAYLSGAYFADLITWYHLAWTGETERRNNGLLAELMAKGTGFTHADRLSLLRYIGDTMRGLVARYKALSDRGQVELSATPYTHPLAPLLIDFGSARESLPDAALPGSLFYPGGRNRVASHVSHALASHASRFGKPAQGIWPAEGAVSNVLLQQLAEQGVGWAASSEGVLVNSLRHAHEPTSDRHAYLYKPYQIETAPGMKMFFRDENLSDLIGFGYSKWHGRDAAAHFISQLEAIQARALEGETPLVCVFLDGENAWEYYPYNAYYFFEDLYGLLEKHQTIRTTTPSDYLSRHPQSVGRLPQITAGSWVYGTMSTWIGNADKNRAWDLLCDAKQSYDLVTASGRLSADDAEAAETQLAVCESSDWFWWFGDYNPPRTVESFDRLFRNNLQQLYRLLKLPVPESLSEPICKLPQEAMQFEHSGTMRRASS